MIAAWTEGHPASFWNGRLPFLGVTADPAPTAANPARARRCYPGSRRGGALAAVRDWALDELTVPSPGGHSPAMVTRAEAAAAMAFALAEKAEATRRAYRSDFRIFSDWCRARGIEPVPAPPEAVAAFLAAEATAGARASTIMRRAAAIRYAHALAGADPPTANETVRATIRGIRRTVGTAPAQKAPATADLVREMVSKCGDDMRGKRDRALLLLGFAGAFRRSELVALDVADLTWTPEGMRVLIRSSKTDQERVGQEIAVPAGTRLRPVEAVRAWIGAAGISGGPLFRRVRRGGHPGDRALSDDAVAAVVKRYALLAGMRPQDYAGHSLRAGFLTSGAEAGASIFKLMEVSRHVSVDTLAGYVRRADLFRDHAGGRFL